MQKCIIYCNCCTCLYYFRLYSHVLHVSVCISKSLESHLPVFCYLGSVSEGGGPFSPSEALRARTGSKGHNGESEELQRHQR